MFDVCPQSAKGILFKFNPKLRGIKANQNPFIFL